MFKRKMAALIAFAGATVMASSLAAAPAQALTGTPLACANTYCDSDDDIYCVYARHCVCFFHPVTGLCDGSDGCAET